MTKTIKIQPKERDDMTLPYPYFVDSKTGEVERQDFWKGKPLKLIGFNPEPDANTHSTSIDIKTFVKKPKLAIGMYPIFEHKDEKWFTYKDPIENVKVL